MDRLARHHPHRFEGLRAQLEVAAEITAQREINDDALMAAGPVFRLITNALRAIAYSAGEIPRWHPCIGRETHPVPHLGPRVVLFVLLLPETLPE